MKSRLLFIFLFLSVHLFGQKQPVTVKLHDPNSFSMVVLPDPQSYNKFDVNQPLFELMTAWVANNIERLNLKTVLCTGDLVEQNGICIPESPNGNQTSKEQWQAASRTFQRLDHKIPYIVCTGNHDYGYKSAENRMTDLHKYFYPERNSCWEKTLVAVANNAEGIPTLENAAYEFNTETWGKLLVLSLEFAPRDEVLEWALAMTRNDKYKDHKVIVLTHSYIDKYGKRMEKEGYKVTPANYGQAIWEKLIYPSKNIIMTVNGHIASIEPFEKNVSFSTDKNSAGRTVAQMMFNAQTADGSWHGNGGDGWLRILEFLPDGKTIKVRTFSPLFAISPLTADKAWRTESFDQFDIIISN